MLHFLPIVRYLVNQAPVYLYSVFAAYLFIMTTSFSGLFPNFSACISLTRRISLLDDVLTVTSIVLKKELIVCGGTCSILLFGLFYYGCMILDYWKWVDHSKGQLWLIPLTATCWLWWWLSVVIMWHNIAKMSPIMSIVNVFENFGFYSRTLSSYLAVICLNHSPSFKSHIHLQLLQASCMDHMYFVARSSFELNDHRWFLQHCNQEIKQKGHVWLLQWQCCWKTTLNDA